MATRNRIPTADIVSNRVKELESLHGMASIVAPRRVADLNSARISNGLRLVLVRVPSPENRA